MTRFLEMMFNLALFWGGVIVTIVGVIFVQNVLSSAFQGMSLILQLLLPGSVIVTGVTLMAISVGIGMLAEIRENSASLVELLERERRRS